MEIWESIMQAWYILAAVMIVVVGVVAWLVFKD